MNWKTLYDHLGVSHGAEGPSLGEPYEPCTCRDAERARWEDAERNRLALTPVLLTLPEAIDRVLKPLDSVPIGIIVAAEERLKTTKE